MYFNQRKELAMPKDDRRFKLLALAPEESNRYNQTLSALLETLIIERIHAQAVLISFDKAIERGTSALSLLKKTALI